MKLKKSHLLIAATSLIILIVLFYPRVLPTIDVRSTSPIIIESSEK